MRKRDKNRFSEFRWKITFTQQLLVCSGFWKVESRRLKLLISRIVHKWMYYYSRTDIFTEIKKKLHLSLWDRSWIITILSLLFHVSCLDHEENLEIKHGKITGIFKCYGFKLCEINQLGSLEPLKIEDSGKSYQFFFSLLNRFKIVFIVVPYIS